MPEGSGYHVNVSIRRAVSRALENGGEPVTVDLSVTYNTFMSHKNKYEGVVLSFKQHDDQPTTPEGNSSGSRLGTLFVQAVDL